MLAVGDGEEAEGTDHSIAVAPRVAMERGVDDCKQKVERHHPVKSDLMRCVLADLLSS
jgi:hypothetical protein